MFIDDIIPKFEWITPRYDIEKLKTSYEIIKFVNNKENNRPYFMINNIRIYIPDSAIYHFKNNSVNSPLKSLWETTEFKKTEYCFDIDNFNYVEFMICLIIINSGYFDAFSFIDPIYLPNVYKFIDLYIPEMEKYISTAINRIINTVLSDKKNDASRVLLNMYEIIPDIKYPSFKNAVGYTIWCNPVLASEIIKEFDIPENDKYCHNKIMWSDVFATLLVIKYAPEDELKKLNNYRIGL